MLCFDQESVKSSWHSPFQMVPYLLWFVVLKFYVQTVFNTNFHFDAEKHEFKKLQLYNAQSKLAFLCAQPAHYIFETFNTTGWCRWCGSISALAQMLFSFVFVSVTMILRGLLAERIKVEVKVTYGKDYIAPRGRGEGGVLDWCPYMRTTALDTFRLHAQNTQQDTGHSTWD